MSGALITASREALVTELRRHIGAHADIVANDLIASGAVIDAATMTDDEALACAYRRAWGSSGDFVPKDYVDARRELRALAAALAERGNR